MRGIKTIGYCSSWDSDNSELGIEHQKNSIHDYAARHCLSIQDFVADGDSPHGRIFSGWEYISSIISSHQVDHIIISSIDRVCTDSSQAPGLLARFIDSHVVLHIIDWNIRSTDLSYKFLVRSLLDLQSIDQGISTMNIERLRSLSLWHRIHGMLGNESYAGKLIESLFRAQSVVFANRDELDAVHGAYDHMQLFSALGFRIKGESTNNTCLVADVLTRNWEKIKRVMDQGIMI